MVGKDVVFNHRGLGTVISSNAKIGDNTWVEHHVTIGIRKTGDYITVGHDCYIGCYSQILGNVTIGNNCYIGAGTLVLEDVPDNTTIVNPRNRKAIKHNVLKL